MTKELKENLQLIDRTLFFAFKDYKHIHKKQFHDDMIEVIKILFNGLIPFKSIETCANCICVKLSPFRITNFIESKYLYTQIHNRVFNNINELVISYHQNLHKNGYLINSGFKDDDIVFNHIPFHIFIYKLITKTNNKKIDINQLYECSNILIKYL